MGRQDGRRTAHLHPREHAKTAPHSLSDDKLDPIVAWILERNGEQGGDKPLTKDTAESAKVPKK